MMRRLIALMCAAIAAVSWIAPAEAQSTESRRAQVNRGIIGVISGGVDGTYIRIATDLAAVLDDRETLRILPIAGRGSVQNIIDLMYLRGIDIGIVQSDVLAYMRRENMEPGLQNLIGYITRLYNEEFHLLAAEDIDDIADLAGRRVNIDVRGSGTFVTASLVFDALGIAVEPVSVDNALALEMLRRGEIAAMAYVAGKPTQLFRTITAEDRLHFLAVPQTAELLETYLPSWLGAEEYPQLIPDGTRIETVAVSAVMAVYNWRPGSERYDSTARFVDAFFSRFDQFQQPPRHRKWREVNLTAPVPGWTRFSAAEAWLRDHGYTPPAAAAAGQ